MCGAATERLHTRNRGRKPRQALSQPLSKSAQAGGVKGRYRGQRENNEDPGGQEMNHEQDYPAKYLTGILKEVKTIAMVGASSDPAKFSYGVLRVLHETGYDMIPVNPNEAGGDIRGLKCVESLAAIDRPVDMVEVFRTSEDAYAVTEEAIEIGAKVVWMQIGVRNDAAAALAEAAGLKVVMNRCPKIELFRPFWRPRLNQAI